MKNIPDEIAADGSHEASYGWWVENSPTNHSHHVVHGTRSSIAALRVLLAALEQAETKVTRLTAAVAGTVEQVEQQRKRAEQAEAKLAESEREVERLRKLPETAPFETAEELAAALAAERERSERERERLDEALKGKPVIKSEWELLLAERDALRAEVERLQEAAKPVLSWSSQCPPLGDMAQEQWRVALGTLRAALAIRQQEEPKPAKPQAQVIDLMQALKDSLKAKPETMEEGK